MVHTLGENVINDRRKARRRAKRSLKKKLRYHHQPGRFNFWFSFRQGQNRQKDNVETIRSMLEDKKFKIIPGIILMNEQHRKRESKRCGRMMK